MRQDFASDVPRKEQLKRVAKAKQTGRKHNHTPSSRVLEKRKAGAKAWRTTQDSKFREMKDKVAAYWRGEIDTHP